MTKIIAGNFSENISEYKMKLVLEMREIKNPTKLSKFLDSAEQIYQELISNEKFKCFLNGFYRSGISLASPYIESYYKEMRYYLIEDEEETIIAAYAEIKE